MKAGDVYVDIDDISSDSHLFAFIPLCDFGSHVGLSFLIEDLPSCWLWHHPNGGQGGIVDSRQWHASLLLNVHLAKHGIQLLKQLCKQTTSFSVQVISAHVSDVARLKKSHGVDVACLAVGLKSEGVRVLKQQWLKEANVKDVKKNDPYGNEGHISMVYVKGEHKKDLEEWLKKKQEQEQWKKILATCHSVEAICIEASSKKGKQRVDMKAIIPLAKK